MTEAMKTDVKDLEDNLKQANGILEKSAAYIAQTQPQLDKYAAFDERFMKRASEIAGVLVDRGIIPAAESKQLIEKLAEDKVRALELVGRLARMVGPDSLGSQSEVKMASSVALDPFEALVLYDDCTNTKGDSPLMVD